MRISTLCSALLLVFTVLAAGLALAQSDTNGTWTQMTNVPINPDTMFILTDGSIAVVDYAAGDVWRLVPDKTGHYLNGTWVPMGYMPAEPTDPTLTLTSFSQTGQVVTFTFNAVAKAPPTGTIYTLNISSPAGAFLNGQVVTTLSGATTTTFTADVTGGVNPTSTTAITGTTSATCRTAANTAGTNTTGAGYNGCPYAPYDMPGAVLEDGRLVIQGGEYIYDAAFNDYAAETTQGAVWNWQTNTWSILTPPSGFTSIGDADSIVLANGQYILARNSGGTGNVAIMTPEGSPGNFGPLTWTVLAPPGKAESSSEEDWVLLPDGSIWTPDVGKEPESERYIPPYLSTADPTTGQWIQAGNEPSTIGVTVDKGADEDGANVLLPNGTVFTISGNPSASGGGVNAIYTPPTTLLGTGTWSAAPNYPTDPAEGNTYYADCDGPASLLPNGNVFFTGNAEACYDTPSEFFEYIPGNPNLVQVVSPYDSFLGVNIASEISSFYSRFIVLPDGNMLYSWDDAFETYIFTPNANGGTGSVNGGPNPAWAPTITSYPLTVSPGTTNYVVSGTQFNGVSASGYYGDDEQNASNYPLVSFTNGTTGDVQFGRTHDHSTMGVQTGAATVSTYVDTPADLECGSANMVVIANGISSTPMPVTVDCTNSAPAIMTSPSNNSTLTGTSAVFQWEASTAASAYWVDISAVQAGGNDVYQSGSLPSTQQQLIVSSLPANGGTLYVTLRSLFGHLWVSNSYTYTQATINSSIAAVITSPTPGSTLTSSAPIFTWSIGQGGPGLDSTGYWLDIGSYAGGDNYFSSSEDWAGTYQATAGLPVNGSTVYVTLFTYAGGQWQAPNEYTYTAFNAAASAATLSSPAPSSTLTGSSVAFSWSAVTGATDYWLDVSAIQPGGNDIYQSKATTKTSLTVNGLPTNGIPVYVTLYTEFGGQWFGNQYTFTSFNSATGEATMISPTPGSTLSGNQATFTWTSDANATAYWLDISAIQPGGNDVFQSGSLPGTSVTVYSLPGTYPATPIYVTLYSLVQGQWVSVPYTYNSGPGVK